jgi:hypothetical protein
VTFPDLQPVMANAPWAAVLVICVPILAVVAIVAICVLSVPKDKRVDAIKASAEVVKAMRLGSSKRKGPVELEPPP